MIYRSLMLLVVALLIMSCRDEPCPAPTYGTHMLEPEWVLVRPGTFRMGSPSSADEQHPRMRVTLTRPYWIQTSEVTKAESRSVARAYIEATGELGLAPENWDPEASKRIERIEEPVPELGNGEEWQAAASDNTFYLAVRYANARSTLDGYEQCYRTDLCEPPFVQFTTTTSWEYQHWCAVGAVAHADPDCRGYRLPSEAEWEWAARARGESSCQRPGACMSRVASTYGGDRIEGNLPYSFYTYPGTKCPNELGLYDMLGNVPEWTSDITQLDTPFFYDSPLVDPVRPVPDYDLDENGVAVRPGVVYTYEEFGEYLRWQPRVIARGGSFQTGIDNIAPYHTMYGDYRASFGWRLVRTAFEEMDE